MLALYVFNPDDDFDDHVPPSALRVSEYLSQRPPWSPDLVETLLLLEARDGNALLELNPFGLLDYLVPQLAEAANRLQTGERALVRSAGDWTPTFLALEPAGEITRLSALATIPRPVGAYYPLDESPFFAPERVDQREALYTYVENHRDSLYPDASSLPAKSKLQGIELPTHQLIAGLRHEVKTGRQFLEEAA